MNNNYLSGYLVEKKHLIIAVEKDKLENINPDEILAGCSLSSWIQSEFILESLLPVRLGFSGGYDSCLAK